MSKPRSISTVVPKLTKKAFGQKSGLFGKLLVNWADIVGQTLAARVKPAELHYQTQTKDGQKKQRIVMGLYVRDGGTALEVQYQTQQLIEKINMFLGYNAVCDIRFVQAPEQFCERDGVAYGAEKHISEENKEKVSHIMEDLTIEDEELKKALENLGRHILTKNAEN